MAGRKENVVMFPFMAQGHIIPLLALALQVEQRQDYDVIFVNTPLNIKNLRASLPANSSIRLLEIPFFPTDHGLPPGTENTDVLPHHFVGKFFEASQSLKPSFRELVFNLVNEQNGKPPLCIISDMFLEWCAEIAHEFGLFHAFFVGSGGFGTACYHSLWLNLPHRNTDSEDFLLPDFPEASRIHVTQLSRSLTVADTTDSVTVSVRKLLLGWSNADGILLNSVEELDNIGLMHLRRKIQRPVWSIGPVLLSTKSRVVTGITPEMCKKWLDTKSLNSVLYVAFGSQHSISASQMMELAKALEASGKNFVWVVSPPLGSDVNMEFKCQEWLPEGFEHRIKESNRGLLVKKCAPQKEILSHKSISAFLSHCGWNSVLEALSHGVPILGWPIDGEQFYNAKFLEEHIGVCVEVARGNISEVREEAILAKIVLVMDETEKAKEMRRKASEVKEIIKNAMADETGLKGSSVQAMDEFWSEVKQMRDKQGKDH